MWVPLLAALTLIPTQTWIRQGPVLAGSHVVWTSDPASVYSSAPVRRLWRAGSVSVPRGLPKDPRFSYTVGQDISALTASASTTVFVRTVQLYRVPNCAGTVPCLGGPIRGDPIRSELWTAQAQGRFRRAAVVTGEGVALDADVDHSTLAYAETVHGEARVVIVRSGRTTTVAATRDVGYPHVAVAGPYVAWIQRSSLEHWPAPPSTVVVYDLAAHRAAYRLGPQELGHAVVSSLDLQADGTVAIASDPSPVGGCDGGVAWASVAQPRLHYLSGDAIPWRVKIAVGRIAYFTRSCIAPMPFRLVVKTVADHTLADGPTAYGGFDFDGHRLAYLQSPKAIRVARLR
jgi:hypothetical protein